METKPSSEENIYKIRAQRWLEYLRGKGRDAETLESLLREDIIRAGCSLADIGTSNEELSELVARGCKMRT